MATRRAVFIYSSELERNPYPADHPFNTVRAKKVREIVNSMGLLSGPSRREAAPEPAERMVLKKFHSARYLQALQRASKGKWGGEALEMGIGTSDCPVFKGLYEGAVLATGGTLVGARMILDGEADVVFNPSGGFHHAMPERASGFCYINDVALACMILAEAGPPQSGETSPKAGETSGKKVLYLDVDVHHGDGVAFAFYERADVMTISLHENPRMLFPGTGFEDEIGSGEGKGYCVNVPLPAGTYDQAYMKAYKEVAVPLIGAFGPDVIVFELGTDALVGDPLAHLRLTNNVYVEIIEHLLSLDKPILATGGGGYNLDNTVRAWSLAWSVFCGGEGGGIVLDRTGQQGGLRDKTLAVSSQQRATVMPAVEATIEAVKWRVFPIHKLR